MLIGGVVPIVNISGVNAAQLVLDGDALAGIYLGEITVWDDPRIQKLNPQIILPAIPTVPIHHSNGSGENQLFSMYLSDSNQNFRLQVQLGSGVTRLGGMGEDDDRAIADAVAAGDGTIGYVDYAFARAHNLDSPKLLNRGGYAVLPTPETLQAGAAPVVVDNWPGRPHCGPPAPPPPDRLNAWPMAGASFALIPLMKDSQRTLAFFNWTFGDGVHIAISLHQVPLTDSMIDSLRANGMRPASVPLPLR